MKETTIAYPEDFPQLLKLSDSEFSKELRFLAAAKLYELGRFTASQAARLADLDRLGFLAQLDRIGAAAINLRDDEIEAEIEEARELAR